MDVICAHLKSLLHAVYQVSKKTNAKACSRHKNSEIVSSDKVIVIHEPLMSSALKNENVQEDMLSQSVHEEIKITGMSNEIPEV